MLVSDSAYWPRCAMPCSPAANQLTGIRAAKKLQVETHFRSIREGFGAIAAAPAVVLALEDMAEGYRQLAETIDGLCKAELIHRRGPWWNLEAVEFATLERVDWYSNPRLLSSIGNIPTAEAEAAYHAALEVLQPIAV